MKHNANAVFVMLEVVPLEEEERKGEARTVFRRVALSLSGQGLLPRPRHQRQGIDLTHL
jgi:hypothetical protein